MPTQKPVTQYSTLDVLLMLLLFLSRKTICIPAELFKKHSLYLATHQTVSIAVRWPDKDHIRTGVVRLRCVSKKKLRNLIGRYLALYRKGQVKSTERVWTLTDKNLRWMEYFFVRTRLHRRRIEACFDIENISWGPMIAPIPLLNVASHMLMFSYNGHPVRACCETPRGTKLIVIEVANYEDWDNMVSFLGWRVRIDSSVAKYKERLIKFDSATNKQKLLLDHLVVSKGKCLIDDLLGSLAINCTDRKDPQKRRAAEKKILRGLGRQLTLKAEKACEGPNEFGCMDKVEFQIEVATEYVRMYSIVI